MNEQNLTALLRSPLIHPQRSIRRVDVSCSGEYVWGVGECGSLSGTKVREQCIDGGWDRVRWRWSGRIRGTVVDVEKGESAKGAKSERYGEGGGDAGGEAKRHCLVVTVVLLLKKQSCRMYVE